MITDDVIAEGLRLDAERTQGEWTHHPDPGKDCPECGESDCEGELITYKPNNCNDVGIAVTLTDARCVKNAEFMCHAANHYAAALREVQRLREALNRIHNQLRHDDKLYAESPVVRRVINLIRVVLEENSNG